MAKGYRTYLPEQDLLLPPRLGEWLPENHLVYLVSEVVDQLDLSAMHAVYEKEKRGTTALRSAADDEAIGVRLLHGSVQFTPDSETDAGRHRLQSAGGGKRAGLPDDLGLSQDPSGISEEHVRASAGDGDGVRLDQVGQDIAGRDEGEGQREQTQGHELRPDDREATATEGRSEAVAGAGRGRRRGGRSRVWRQARRRVAGGAAAARDSAGQDQRSQEGAGTTGAGQGARRRQECRGGQTGQASRQGSIQLHRSGVAHHAGRGWDCPGLQRASRGGADIAVDRRPNGDGGEQ